ncbi:MAG: polyprenyl synthetase family protein [Bacteroidota bacterium]|nr:polyprenyl synthetase family protein [Bacteroidota bacterium]
MITDAAELRARTTLLADAVSDQLSALASGRTPAALYAPVNYVLSKGGKCFRPVLVLMASEALGVSIERAMPLALAVELVHGFSLVHDDIMDHADSRRGRPTVHVKYDTDTAILAGDTLLNMAMAMVAQVRTGDVRAHLKCLTRAVTGLCEGQALDKQFETATGVRTADYLQMVDLKTGALIAACLELAGIAADVGSRVQSRLRSAGISLGRAFQIQDDLLDLVAEDVRWGKVIGGDLMEGKKTFLLLEAQRRSAGSERAFFHRIHQGAGLRADQIDYARAQMESMGVLQASRDAIARHTEKALALLESVPGSLVEVRQLAQSMAARVW